MIPSSTATDRTPYALDQPLPAEAIAARFKRTPRAGVQAVLEALEELGMVVREDGAYRLQG